MKHCDWPPVWTLFFAFIAMLFGAVWSPLAVFAPVGWALIVASVALAVWAALTMVRVKTAVLPRKLPHALVTAGPFRVSRNPIYLADLGMVAGVALVAGQPLGLVLVVPLAMVLTRRFIADEERRLEACFGAAFQAYCTRVRRWV